MEGHRRQHVVRQVGAVPGQVGHTAGVITTARAPAAWNAEIIEDLFGGEGNNKSRTLFGVSLGVLVFK